MIHYSREIDGLRAVSVILVLLFHTNSGLVSGGYIGVDVFFVISGYLITSLIQSEINRGDGFSFLGFYRRRFARLLPSLIITLLLTLAFGFLFYGPTEFDSLGRDIFFSALGLKNFLDAMGANYFVQDEALKPLLHIWSLGVEEQYYVVWPLFLVLVYSVFRSRLLLLAIVLLTVFLIVSEVAVRQDLKGVYFLPQYRAVELLVGSVVALAVIRHPDLLSGRFTPAVRSGMSLASFGILIGVALSFDAQTAFPGLNALLVAIPTVLIILFSHGTILGRLLGHKYMVGIGLISYPLYLFHQPLISFALFFDAQVNRAALFVAVFLLGSLLSFGTYRYLETPARRIAKTAKGNLQAFLLVSVTVLIAGAGVFVAKLQGLPERLSMLNPYAYSVEQAISSSFHKNFQRGIHSSGNSQGKILFVGDSLLQQYVVPLARHWGYALNQVDVISRGGCVLLDAVDYKDTFSDISCDDLRKALYSQTQRYEKIVVSQGWHLYGGQILNADLQANEYSPMTWKPFIKASLEKLSPYADHVYVIGPHPKILGDCNLKTTPFTTPQSVKSCVAQLKIDEETLQKKSAEFSQALNDIPATLLMPSGIWCEEGHCPVEGDGQPYFKDAQHFGVAADGFVQDRMQKLGW